MFIQSNSYCLKDSENNVFSTILHGDISVSHFVSTQDGHVFSSKNELFVLKDKGRRKISSFRSDITSLSSWQSLICAGTSDGEVQIFSEHRASIRRFKDHSAEITDIVIGPNSLLVSSGRDSTINFYDLVEGRLIHTLKLQSDCAKCLLVEGGILYAFSKHIVAISLSNFEETLLYAHSSVIDAACLIEDGLAVFSCKNRVFLLDLLSKRITKSQIIHTKEITSIQSYEGKLYTCSLDGHLKTFNNNLRTISDFNFNVGLVSFSLVDDPMEDNGKMPFVASEDGRVFSLERERIKSGQRNSAERRPAHEDEIDFEVVQTSKKRLGEIDGMLRRYEYKGALISCMRSGSNTQKYAVLRHISEKRAMMRALRDGDVEFVRSVLGLCIETLRIEEFTPIIVEALFVLTSVYADVLVEDSDAREQVEILSEAINEQVAFEEAYLKTVSFIESFSSTIN